MNSQPNSNTTAVRNLTNTTFNLSTKETLMNRRIATVLFTLFAVLILSACAVPSPFQSTGSVTILPKEAAAPKVSVASGLQINDRQQLADYQASLSNFAVIATAPKVSVASGLQINDRQQLAEYQASLSNFAVIATAPKVSAASGLQVNDRQQLADYQASLSNFAVIATAPKVSVASGLQINDRQQLAEYQATLQ